MSPEYAVKGLFSIKSDVYSFGVLVIETITGQKNSGYYHSDTNSSLVGHVRIQVHIYVYICTATNKDSENLLATS